MEIKYHPVLPGYPPVIQQLRLSYCTWIIEWYQLLRIKIYMHDVQVSTDLKASTNQNSALASYYWFAFREIITEYFTQICSLIINHFHYILTWATKCPFLFNQSTFRFPIKSAGVKLTIPGAGNFPLFLFDIIRIFPYCLIEISRKLIKASAH
jgi:hypothetical protein